MNGNKEEGMGLDLETVGGRIADVVGRAAIAAARAAGRVPRADAELDDFAAGLRPVAVAATGEALDAGQEARACHMPAAMVEAAFGAPLVAAGTKFGRAWAERQAVRA